MADIWIAIGICLLTAAMAYMGVHVTLHPPESPTAKVWWKIGFVWVAILACILIGIQTKRNSDSQAALKSQLNRIQSNTETPPQVTVNVPPATPPNVILNPAPPTIARPDRSGDVTGKVDVIPTEIRPGTQLALNLELLNRSSLPVDSLSRYFSVATTLIPNAANWETPEDADVDRRIYKQLHRAAIKEAQSSKFNQQISVEPGKGVYNTLAVTFNTQDDVNNFMNGKARIYAYIWGRWRGSSRDLEECQWMQPPTTTVISSNEHIVWHACSH